MVQGRWPGHGVPMHHDREELQSAPANEDLGRIQRFDEMLVKLGAPLALAVLVALAVVAVVAG